MVLKNRVDVALAVMEERRSQIEKRGYTEAHDDEHQDGQLAMLAAAYALQACPLSPKVAKPLRNAQSDVIEFLAAYWGASEDFFKSHGPIRDLIVAAALLLAEIERRVRAGEVQDSQGLVGEDPGNASAAKVTCESA